MFLLMLILLPVYTGIFYHFVLELYNRNNYVFIEISTFDPRNSIEISIYKIQSTSSYIPLTGFSPPLWHKLLLHAKLLLFPSSKIPISPANPTFLPLSTPVAVADK